MIISMDTSLVIAALSIRIVITDFILFKKVTFENPDKTPAVLKIFDAV